jgi:hypothetical protein
MAPRPSSAPAAAAAKEPLKLPLSFYFWQHIGFVICLASVFALVLKYENPPIANKTHWTLLCFGGCLLGLLFHEFRPFSVGGASWPGRHRASACQHCARQPCSRRAVVSGRRAPAAQTCQACPLPQTAGVGSLREGEGAAGSGSSSNARREQEEQMMKERLEGQLVAGLSWLLPALPLVYIISSFDHRGGNDVERRAPPGGADVHVPSLLRLDG